MTPLPEPAADTAAAAREPLPPALWPLAAWLRRAPDAWHAAVLARALDGILGWDGLQPLEGRRVTIAVVDTGNRLCFRVLGGRVRGDPCAGAPDAACDVTIRGALIDFVRLAARTVDPDTLFFARRLCLEGDTEAGLYLKNLLDALEFDWRGTARRLFGESAAARLVRAIERSGIEPRARRLVERILKAPP